MTAGHHKIRSSKQNEDVGGRGAMPRLRHELEALFYQIATKLQYFVQSVPEKI